MYFKRIGQLIRMKSSNWEISEKNQRRVSHCLQKLKSLCLTRPDTQGHVSDVKVFYEGIMLHMVTVSIYVWYPA